MPLDLRKDLNDSQFKAVTTTDHPVLVIAGAGSGKTRVIEYKVLHLIQNNNLDPQSILLLTFTRKAASEMLARAARHDTRCEQIHGGTFHSYAYKLLKHYAKNIGFSNSFSILDEGDASELVGRCSVKLGFMDMERRFPKKETLKAIISKSVNKQTSVKSILEREHPQFEEFADDIKRVQSEYARYKLEADYVDYDDLLIYMKILLEKYDLRERITSAYKYVMVDEYQDTNKLQGDITYLLASDHGNIMAVGDDAQSIYGFRGATHENIMDFPIKFPGCEIIKLEENYRSTQSILDVSNAVLDNMKHKYEKRLVSSTDDKGLRPQILCFKNPYEEASWIAQGIKQLRDQGISLGRQAVLFRSAYISIPLQAELSRLNIPFQVFGGLKFYETAHVKDMVSYLKILQNPKDELAWSRALRLIEGVGPKTGEKIFTTVKSCFNFDQVVLSLKQTFSGLSFASNLNSMAETLESASGEGITVGEQFEILLKFYKPYLKRKYDEWHLRLSDLEMLRDIAAGYSSLNEFLADLALEPPQQGVAGIDPACDDEKPLSLSTIHSAKGLEWEVVFVIGLIDGVLPSRFSLKFSDQIEEEHRLFYVAVTRAKSQLYLSMHNEGTQGGMYQFNRISRFLENRNILEKLEQQLVDQEKVQRKDKTVRLVSDDFEDIDVTDKKSLFKKINDSWNW